MSLNDYQREIDGINERLSKIVTSPIHTNKEQDNLSLYIFLGVVFFIFIGVLIYFLTRKTAPTETENTSTKTTETETTETETTTT